MRIIIMTLISMVTLGGTALGQYQIDWYVIGSGGGGSGAGGYPLDAPHRGPRGGCYGAMDVNGTCSTNGIDITFFVTYLKGGQPALLYCIDCPPAGMAAPPGPAVMPVNLLTPK